MDHRQRFPVFSIWSFWVWTFIRLGMEEFSCQFRRVLVLGPVEPGTYFVDPDLDPSTPLRVVYDIEPDGLSM